jgi:hypothetical protein
VMSLSSSAAWEDGDDLVCIQEVEVVFMVCIQDVQVVVMVCTQEVGVVFMVCVYRK